MKDQIVTGVKTSNGFSLAIDETGDNGIAQMGAYVRYFDGSRFCDELLELVPLHAHTCGMDFYVAITDLFKSLSIDLNLMKCIVTDGCPAMVSKNVGLVALLRKDVPQLIAFHCIIHQSVLTAKLSSELSEIMQTLVKLVNYICSTSHLQRLLRSFLQDAEAEYTDLLLHNDVRWLSKGATLRRLWTVRVEIIDFLSQSKRKGAEEYKNFCLIKLP